MAEPPPPSPPPLEDDEERCVPSQHPQIRKVREEDREAREWGDWEEEEAASAAPALCPFCREPVSLQLDTGAGPAQAILAHCRRAHDADLLAVRAQWRLGDYGWIRLVNWLRRQPAPVPAWPALGVTSPQHPLFSDDSNLLPAMPNDPLLALLSEDDDDDEGEGGVVNAASTSLAPTTGATAELEMAREETRRLREAIQRILLDDPAADAASGGSGSSSDEADAVDVENDGYFNSYARAAIHEEMLRDTARTGAYAEWARRAGQTGLLRGKTVLDVGAGTGILSIFCAREGAAKVYAVEASATAEVARRVVAANGLSDVVEIVHSTVETARLPPGTRVDVIVSEWMGYALLYENMLDSVLYARDTWLAPGGSVQPSHARIFLSALDCPHEYTDRRGFFDSRPYGVDLSPARSVVFAEAAIELADAQEIVAGPLCIAEIDINRVPRGSLETAAFPVAMRVSRDATALHCFCVHFDVLFRMPGIEQVTLSTAPDAQPTHWKQSVLYLDEPVTPCPSGTEINGTVRFHSCLSGPHDLDIELDLHIALPVAPLTIKKLFHV